MLAAVTTGPRPGLRERKKLATRRELAIAALRLAVERGVDNVLTDDIAAAAGVSSRTFNNYFASKYEAIGSIGIDRAERTSAALRERPPGEPLREALLHAILQEYATAEEPQGREWIAGLRLAVHCPPLQAEFLRNHRAAQHSLAEAIADRLGTDWLTDMLPIIISGAVHAAIQAAMLFWLRAEPPVALASLMRTALRQLTEDFPALLAPDPASTATPTARTP